MRTQLVDDPCHSIRIDRWDGREVVRGEQHSDPGGVTNEDLVHERRVDRVDVVQQVGDAVGASQVERDADVAELEVKIDQRDRCLAAMRERHGEVGGDRRASDAALGAVNGDHRGRAATGRGCAVDALQAPQLLQVGERVADRRHEVLRLIGLRDDPGRDIRAGHDDAALGSPREDLVDRRADLAPEPREVDEGDLGVGRPELVQQRGLIDDGPDEEHPLLTRERLLRERRRIRVGLEDEHADRADSVDHRAIPND